MPLLAKDLISEEIPPLKTTDSARKAIQWMDEFKVSHLPVISGVKYLGLVSEPELLDLNSPEEQIGKSSNEFIQAHVTEYKHIFDVVRAISVANISVIPVLGEKGNYMGAISLIHLMKVVAELAMVKDAGGTIILEVNVNDYSLTQIANIIESNNGESQCNRPARNHPDI
jgi:acetoin utilization protein AcuB